MTHNHNNSVLITGATGGIGCAISEAFAKNGAKLAISGTNQAKLEILAERLKALGAVHVEAIPFNLNSDSNVESIIDIAHDALEGLDVLICNAGITKDALAIRMTDENWDEVLKVNLYSTFKLNKAAAAKMIKNRFGRIINITSVIGFIGNPGQANYAASKAAITGFSKSLAKEVGSRNITVNCIAPGFIVTPMTNNLPDKAKDSILNQIPLQRFGTPEDVAHTALFLASDGAGYITGNTVHVNGGLYTT